MTARQELNTSRVPSEWGTHYVHVIHSFGVVNGVRVSAPGKLWDTELGDMLSDIDDIDDIKAIREQRIANPLNPLHKLLMELENAARLDIEDINRRHS